MTSFRFLTLTLLALALPISSAAKTTDPGVYIIFDASGSMWGKLPNGKTKITVARQVLRDSLSNGFGGRPIALRAYGHRRKGDCSDTELIQAFSTDAQAVSKMRRFVKQVNPRGKTPISRSLRAALKDFGDRAGRIILISDGVETCNADPCALVNEWVKKNIAIQVHVVGLGLNKKESKAMQCIAKAAGTEYTNAQSASDLLTGLGKIKEQVGRLEFRLIATSKDGQSVRTQGNLRRADGTSIAVSTQQRHVIEAGDYQLTAGVPTRNGNIYRPISRKVTVKAAGTTRVNIVVAIPPRVSVRYLDRGKQTPIGIVTAHQNGERVFKFRAKDEVYLDEGQYEFRAQPNKFNRLSRQESFTAGDRKVLEFTLARSVRLKVYFVASGSKVRYRGDSPELWQATDKKFTLNGSSGGLVLPGEYNAVFSTVLTGKLVKKITVTDEAVQVAQIIVPSGQTTFVYENADGSRAKNKRVFVSRADRPNSRKYVSGGKKTDLPVGQYSVAGFNPPKGFKYLPITFSVSDSTEQTIIIRPIPDN